MWARFRRNRGAVAGLAVLLVFFCVALFAPLATTYAPEDNHLDQKLLEPTPAHLLGTDHLGRDIWFYSLSIDPKHDTPATLKAYADSFHAGPGWLFLTGKKEDIGLIRKKLGLYARTGEDQLTDHTTSVMIGNEATGEWIKDSSLDNPQYMATIVRDWLNAGKGFENKTATYAIPDHAADKGGYLFNSRCAACHTIGGGDSVGPDLQGVTHRRDRTWLTHFITAPNEMLAQKDPTATALFTKYKQVTMPNLRLSEVDVKALLGYLEKDVSQKTEVAQTAAK